MSLLIFSLVSCSDTGNEPKDSDFITIRGFQNINIQGNILDELGDKNEIGMLCTSNEDNRLIAFPSISNKTISLRFSSFETQQVEIWYETAHLTKTIADSISILLGYEFVNHTEYKDSIVRNVLLVEGEYTNSFDVSGLDKGAYIVHIARSKEFDICTPIIVK
jgi:hypothetical protein